MARLKLTVAYVGTHLHGWQIQAHENHAHLRTVQGELERIATRVAGVPVRLHGSGRTDSGVHADAQIAHMDIPDERCGINWQRAFNTQLPPDISVIDVTRTADDFHARFDATGKLYTYRIWATRRFIPPRLRDFVWATAPLDIAAMLKAAEHLKGTHDFTSFQNHGTDITSTVRTLRAIECACIGALPETHRLPSEKYCSAQAAPRLVLSATDCATGCTTDCAASTVPSLVIPDDAGYLDAPVELVWTFEADGFLKQMVRNLMGLLVNVGRGKIAHEDVPEIILACDRTRSAVTAPARGLTMTKVFYD